MNYLFFYLVTADSIVTTSDASSETNLCYKFKQNLKRILNDSGVVLNSKISDFLSSQIV